MLRKAGMVFAGMLALVVVLGAATAEEKKAPSISTIMKTMAGSKKAKGLCGKCVAAGKAANWEEAQKLAKSLADCVANLPKNACPRGDAADWEKRAKAFADDAKAIEKAANDKDSKAFAAAAKKFTTSCGACHKAHKGGKKKKQ